MKKSLEELVNQSMEESQEIGEISREILKERGEKRIKGITLLCLHSRDFQSEASSPRKKEYLKEFLEDVFKFRCNTFGRKL